MENNKFILTEKDYKFNTDNYKKLDNDLLGVLANSKDIKSSVKIDDKKFKTKKPTVEMIKKIKLMKSCEKLVKDCIELVELDKAIEIKKLEKKNLKREIVKDDFKFSNFRAIEKLEFSDGSFLNKDDIYNLSKYKYGTANNDNIVLENGNFTVEAGKGNDIITGSAGDTTYVFYRGDGTDVIQGEKDYSNLVTTDTIKFIGNITEEDVVIKKINRDLVIEVLSKDKKTIDNKIIVKDDYKYSNFRAIEKIVFSDGTIFDKSTIYAKAEIISGTANNDNIVLENGNFTVEAGKGNDTITGSAGDTTYIFNRGDGTDTIQGEKDYSNYETVDTIKFTGDIVSDDVVLRKDGRNLVIEVYSKDKKNIDNKIIVRDDFKYSNFRAIEKIEFSDGTIMDKKHIYNKARSKRYYVNKSVLLNSDSKLNLNAIIENDKNITTNNKTIDKFEYSSGVSSFGANHSKINVLVDSMSSFDVRDKINWKNTNNSSYNENSESLSEIWINQSI